MIDFKHVYKTYTPEKHCLRDVNFSIKKAELVFLIGPSGAGKTTLFKLISAYEKASSGEINILGNNLNEIRIGQVTFLRRKLGFVLQNYKLLKHKTVSENIELPLIILNEPTKVRSEKIATLLSTLSLTEVKDQYPEFLSGGEQQRVAIARALIHNPEIIIADEPTGNLDPELSYTTMKIFSKFAEQGTSCVIATHDHRLVKRFVDEANLATSYKVRILKINNGQIGEVSSC